MSWLSKNVFDPIKALLAGNENALAQLGSAQATIDAAVKTAVADGTGYVMKLLPAGNGLKIEILTDVIAGLQAELATIQNADILTPPAAVAASYGVSTATSSSTSAS